MPTLQTATIAAIKLVETTTPATPAAGSYKIYVKDDGFMYLLDDAGNEAPFSSSAPVLNDYVCIQHQETQNTSGGTITTGDWRTRPLNYEQSDTAGHASVASNQITLAAGTYITRIVSSVAYCGNHRARLQNITAGTTLLTGTSGYTTQASPYSTGESFIAGLITLASSSVLEVQHRCGATQNTNGFGQATNWGTEVYATVEFWKIA